MSLNQRLVEKVYGNLFFVFSVTTFLTSLYLICQTKSDLVVRDRSSNIRLGIILMSVFIIGFLLFGSILLNFEGLPYNVKEIFPPEKRYFSLILFAAILLITGAAPVMLVRIWVNKPIQFLAIGPLAMVLLSNLVFFLLWLAAPLESLNDIVGSPILEIPHFLERLFRFTGLYLGPLAALCIGLRLTLYKIDYSFLAGLGSVSCMGILSYFIVIRFAATDNLTELLRDFGNSAAIALIAIYIMLLGILASILMQILFTRLSVKKIGLVFLSLFNILQSSALGWLLFIGATNPQLEKYGQVFAARQFLLSPDRDNLLDDHMLFPRFAMVHTAIIITLTFGVALGLIFSKSNYSERR